MILLKFAVLPILLSSLISNGAELLVIGEKHGLGGSLARPELRLSSSPDLAIRGVDDGVARVKFRDLNAGLYFIIVWGGPRGWDASPSYDATVVLAPDDVKEHHVDQKTPSRTIYLATDIRLQTFFRGFAGVPCKLQRIENGVPAPFSFRWEWFHEQKDGTFKVSSTIKAGSYIVNVPTLPYDPRTGLDVQPSTLLAFPVTFFEAQREVAVSVKTQVAAQNQEAVPVQNEATTGKTKENGGR